MDTARLMKHLSLVLSLALLPLLPLLGMGAVESKPQVEKPAVEAAKAKTHWLTISSGIRHNKRCRWYRNSKGRPCTEDEGRACKKCGG